MDKIWIFVIGLSFIYPISMRAQGSTNMVRIKGGTYVPLYGSDTNQTKVQSFFIDKFPVTNEDYLHFVKKYSKWKKSKVKRIFADENYLKHWESDSFLLHADKIRHSPVTNISWFAAKAYCECNGKRLPTNDEWEFVVQASETQANGSQDAGFYQRSLDWYSKPTPDFFPTVQKSFKNYYGVYGMVGLVWEWVLDYNSILLEGESRANTNLNRDLFCGAGSKGVKDPKNYVAFMRYAFRSSLKANYTVKNLGFRCAKDVEK